MPATLCTLAPSSPRPLITLLVLTCNRPGFLRLALRAASAQTYKHLEAVVVDDGTHPSPSAATLRAEENLDFQVRRVRLRSRTSIGEKRNAGLRLARGQIIMHWDDDDMRHADHVATLACPLLSNWSDFSALTFSYLAKLGSSSVHFFEYAPGRQSRAAFGPFLGSLAYRREVAAALRPPAASFSSSSTTPIVAPFPDASLSEDLHFVERALALCYRMLPVAGLPLVYTRHAASSVRNTWRPTDYAMRMRSDRETSKLPSFVTPELRRAYVAAEKEAARIGACTAPRRFEPSDIVRPLSFPYNPGRCCATGRVPHSRPCTDGRPSQQGSCGDESFCGATKGVCTATCTCAGEARHGRSSATVACGEHCCHYWHTFWRKHPQNCSTMRRMRPLKLHYCGTRGTTAGR